MLGVKTKKNVTGRPGENLAGKEKIDCDCAGEERFEGFNGLIQEVPGYLVVDVHDVADLLVAEILEVFEVNDFFLTVGEVFEGVEDFLIVVGTLFAGDQMVLMAPDEDALPVGERKEGATLPKCF